MRRRARPFGYTTPTPRLFSMLLGIAVLWMLYERVREPDFWNWFLDGAGQPQVMAEAPAADAKAPAAPAPRPAKPRRSYPPVEVPIELKELLSQARDRKPLELRDQAMYMGLMQFVLAHPYDELAASARKDLPFTRLWEQSPRFRGEPVALRLHIRRILENELPENSLGLKRAYEAWGWTEESKSFPYVVVFPELPAGMPLGTDLRVEGEFVGCFYKIMSYQATDNTRGAPLLIGHMRLIPTKRAAPEQNPIGNLVFIISIVILAAFALAAARLLTTRTRRIPRRIPTQELLEEPRGSSGPNPFAFDAEDSSTAALGEPMSSVRTNRLAGYWATQPESGGQGGLATLDEAPPTNVHFPASESSDGDPEEEPPRYPPPSA